MSIKMIIGNTEFKVTLTSQFLRKKEHNNRGALCVVFRSIILFSNFLFKRWDSHKIPVAETF